MKEVLDPLVRIAGVRKVVLVSRDGVPIAAQDAKDTGSDEEEKTGCGNSADLLHALCGLAVGCMAEIRRAVDPLAWDPPQYVALRAAHGTLLVMGAPDSLLVVILERGSQHEDLRVPMEAAVARIQRVLRRAPAPDPPGVLPGETNSPTAPGVESPLFENEIPEVSGER